MTRTLMGGATAAGAALPTNATTGQVLQWNGSAWVPATPSASGTTPNATASAPGLVQLAGDLAGTAAAPTVAKINGATPAPVATSGSYTDLTGRPALAPVATSGSYTDLTGRPALAPVATSGSYGDLTSRPLLAPVATSGSYADLTGRPTIPTAPLLAVKAADTVRTSTAAWTADAELQFTGLAAGVYVLDGALNYVSTAAGVSFQFRPGTGAAAWPVATTTSSVGQIMTGIVPNSPAVGAVAAESVFTAPNNTLYMEWMQLSAVLRLTDPALILGFWQTASNATASTLKAGSFLRLTRIA